MEAPNPANPTPIVVDDPHSPTQEVPIAPTDSVIPMDVDQPPVEDTNPDSMD